MVRKCALSVVAILILAVLASAAWAATDGPRAQGYYGSRKPDLSVYVGKPATTVQLYVSCATSPTISEYWDSPKLRLKDDKFSFDGKTTIMTVDGVTFGHLAGTVIFNGKFSGGVFHGSAQIVGSSCPKSSYTAKYSKDGGGSGR
jgi:hypothetical protein